MRSNGGNGGILPLASRLYRGPSQKASAESCGGTVHLPSPSRWEEPFGIVRECGKDLLQGFAEGLIELDSAVLFAPYVGRPDRHESLFHLDILHLYPKRPLLELIAGTPSNLGQCFLAAKGAIGV